MYSMTIEQVLGSQLFQAHDNSTFDSKFTLGMAQVPHHQSAVSLRSHRLLRVIFYHRIDIQLVS